SNKKAWWICNKDAEHVWEARIVTRTKPNETGCPVCAKRKTHSSLGCLATTHPDIAKQWHPTKNKLTPLEVSARSRKKAWWICSKDNEHVWESKISYKTRMNSSSCSICTNRKVILSNCLATTHPAIAKQWHPTKNKVTPLEVSARSRKKAWWICSKDNEHVWESKISYKTRMNSSSCSICTNRKVILSNCLATTHPDIAKQWHPTKN